MNVVQYSLVPFIFLVGCEASLVGNGDVADDVRMIPSFTGVATWGAISTEVRASKTSRVVVRTDSNLSKFIEVDVVDGVLEVYGQFGVALEPTEMSLLVEVERLTEISALGWGGMVVDGVASDVLKATIGGEAPVRIQGTANTLELFTAETAEFDAQRLLTSDVEMEVDGSGDVKVYATRSVSGVVSGDGDVYILGPEPEVDLRLIGNGTLYAPGE